MRAASTTAGTRSPQSTELPGWTGTVGSTIVLLPAVDVTRVSAEHKHSLTVPAGASALRATTNWGNPALDLDMYVYGPNGQLVASSATGTSASEAVSIPNPPAGIWRVQVCSSTTRASARSGPSTRSPSSGSMSR